MNKYYVEVDISNKKELIKNLDLFCKNTVFEDIISDILEMIDIKTKIKFSCFIIKEILLTVEDRMKKSSYDMILSGVKIIENSNNFTLDIINGMTKKIVNRRNNTRESRYFRIISSFVLLFINDLISEKIDNNIIFILIQSNDILTEGFNDGIYNFTEVVEIKKKFRRSILEHLINSLR